MKKHIIATVIAALSLFYRVPAKAEDRVPDLDPGKTSTVSVYFGTEDKEFNKIPLAGFEIEIYPVADVVTKGGSADYTLLPEYESLAIKLEGMTVSESMDAAVELQEFIEENGIHGEKAVSGSDGYAVYGDLKAGMYLVIQTGAVKEAEDYTEIMPFLLTAPVFDREAGIWNYTVQAMPKTDIFTEVEPKQDPTPTPEPSPTPTPTSGIPTKTGVRSGSLGWAIAGGAALAAGAVLLILKKKEK